MDWFLYDRDLRLERVKAILRYPPRYNKFWFQIIFLLHMILPDNLRSIAFFKTILCIVVKNIFFPIFLENPHVKNVSQF